MPGSVSGEYSLFREEFATMLFRCDLIDDGVLKERFYREEQSKESALETLKMFQLGKGIWKIKPAVIKSDDVVDPDS